MRYPTELRSPAQMLRILVLELQHLHSVRLSVIWSAVLTFLVVAQSEAASSTQEAQKNMAARFQEVHQKAIAKTRLGVKAETYATSRDKNVADTTAWMPFVLPPVGLCLLGGELLCANTLLASCAAILTPFNHAGIVFGVISIRKWQKIPSMPTQGRMDIKDVQASARQAGGSHREMKRPT